MRKPSLLSNVIKDILLNKAYGDVGGAMYVDEGNARYNFMYSKVYVGVYRVVYRQVEGTVRDLMYRDMCDRVYGPKEIKLVKSLL